MFRLTIFIIALLLALGTVEPTGAWLVTLAVLAGIELFWCRPFRWLSGRHPRAWRRWSREFDW